MEAEDADEEQILKDHRSMFALPVDADQKATELRLFSIAPPHMLAFHLAWLSLFSNFFSTFSIPPLLAVIRDDLNLTDTDTGHAGTAAFLGSIFSRIAMGPICDLLGPRIAIATLSLLTAPVILSTSLVSSPNSFIAIRFIAGFSLANFVANQFWMSCMFSGCVVGLANGFSAGWANMGSGVTQLVMPLIYSLIMSFNVPSFAAWRLAFIVPAVFQVVTAILVLTFGQDLPSGSYKRSQKVNNKSKESLLSVISNGVKNYRAWILALTYAFSFGVELTTDNIIAQYFYDRFNVNLEVAGIIAASFGMANFFSRPSGADGGRVVVFVTRASHLALGIHTCHVCVFYLCTSCCWPHVWRGAVCVQKVTGSGIRDHRRRRYDGGGGNPAAVVFRHGILQADEHFSDGCDDDCVHPPSLPHLLPSVGWNVLRPFLQLWRSSQRTRN